MGNSRRVPVLLLAALTCGTIRADDSVSAAFTFDARYPASGLTPADWEAHETVGLSERFAAATVMRAADLNGNGSTYEVYSSSDLQKGWSEPPLATIEGTGDVVECVPEVSGAAMFFRVTVRLSY